MIIHFSILGVILLVSSLYERRVRKIASINIIENKNFITKSLPWILVFGYLAFLAAMRTDMNDSYAYIHSFKLLDASWATFIQQITEREKDWAFYAVATLFKMYISDDYHLWFAFYAIIESLAFVHILRRSAVSFKDCCYFFFCSTLYYNYFSMMRQWFAIVILFGSSRLIAEKKTFRYILLCLIMAQFHNSAYLMIPIYFLVQGKAWAQKQLLMIFSFVVLMIFLNPILNSMENMSGLTYNYAISAMNASAGSSSMRILIALVPVLISYIYRTKEPNRMINVCMNVSVINLLLNIMARFTSGLYIIRFSTYISIYNMILYPYVMNILLKGSNKKIIKFGFYICYFLFYIYQMYYQGAFSYISDILGSYY